MLVIFTKTSMVGSSPGGSPVAARLAIAEYKVLLIDAGGEEGSSYQEQIPAVQLQSTEFGTMKCDYFVSHSTLLNSSS